MGRNGGGWCAIACMLFLLGLWPPAVGPEHLAVAVSIEPPVAPPLNVPADFFTENAGQVDNPEVRYYARGGGISVGFAAGAVLVNLRERPPIGEFDPRTGHESAAPATPLRGHLVRITFEGANTVRPQARVELPHRANFFLGDDADGGHTNVRNYGEVVYEDAWNGIDVVYRTSPGGIKYDLVVHPGADLADVAFAYEGVTGLAVDRHGLAAETSLGPLRDDLPAAWQASGRPVDCTVRQIADRTVGYACSGWDGTGDLVIDPLLYSTFLGGGGVDIGYSIAVDASGSAYVSGWTVDDIMDFPATPGAYDTMHNGVQDAFVAKLDANGSALLYSTFLGGSAVDIAYSIAVDASGSAYVSGWTVDDTADFPTTPAAFDTTHNGVIDAFTAKLDASGSGLLYSTFLGAGGEDFAYAIAVDASGSAYVTGETVDVSTDFPVTPGAYDTLHNGAWDLFVTKLDAGGSNLLYSTFLGGGGDDEGWAIAVDASGSAYMTGRTPDAATDFPTTPGAYDRIHNGGVWDAFVAKLDANGSALLYSSFLGASGDDQGRGIAVDASGAAYVTGNAEDAPTDFPTTPGAFDTTHNGGADAFAVKLDAGGRSLLYSTFLGGGGYDKGFGIAADASGSAYVTGGTEDNATDFPTTPGTYDATQNGFTDVFVAKLGANGSSLLYSTFLGGSLSDEGWGITVDASRAAYVTGFTYDDVTDFPTTLGAYDTTHNGGTDALVAKVTIPFLLLPPSNATALAVGPDIQLSWQPSPSPEVDGYFIYGGPTETSLDLVTSLGGPLPVPAWTDLARRVTDAEFYYAVRAWDLETGDLSTTTNTAGYIEVPFSAGLNDFSIPLQPSIALNVSDLRSAIPGALSVDWMDASGRWQRYSSFGDPDVAARIGTAYVVDLAAPATFPFSGLPAAHILFDNGWGFTAADRTALTISDVGLDVTLTWPPVAGADAYEVRVATTRGGGFWTGGYAAIDALGTSYVDPGAAAAAERYYLVIPFRYAAPRDYGASAYGAGVFVVALDRQGSFGLPLRPLAALPVSGHAAQIPSALGILFFEAGTWIPHFTEMPPGVYDVLEARARGYQVSARTPSRLVFVGH